MWSPFLDDLLMKYPDPVAGEVAILDVRDLSTAFLIRGFQHMKTAILLLRKIYAVKLKTVHVLVNPSSGIERILTLLIPFLHPKVKENVRNISFVNTYIYIYIYWYNIIEQSMPFYSDLIWYTNKYYISVAHRKITE